MQDLLGEYDGTVLLVSHDRDFIDRVATTTIALEGGGIATVYAGGWSDYLAQRPAPVEAAPAAKTQSAAPKPAAAAPRKADGLSFTERKRLAELPDVIAKLEREIGKLGELLETPDLFTKEPVKFRKASEMLAERQATLAAAEDEWLVLEEKAGG